MAAVLVTDGEERAALAAVRSLGRAGYSVFVCTARERSLAGASRYAKAEASVPSALSDPDGFTEEVERSVRRWSVRVLLPVSEAALLALLPVRGRFAGVRIPFPAMDVFQAISDKGRVLGCARELGIAVPSYRTLTSAQEAGSVTGREITFPVVVKPTRSVVENRLGRVKTQVRYAADDAALRSALADLPESAYPVLLQRRVLGPGIGIFLLRWGGRIVAAFAHRRIREKPPSGGVSVYRESVRADPLLVQQSSALLAQLGWEGVAMVEYKIDSATGTAYLMEVNGRLWGSLQLAIDAGVDFPTLLVAAALGEEPSPRSDYRTGIRSRWWWGDVDQLLLRLRRGRHELGLPQHAAGPLRSLLRFLVLWRPGDRSEVLRLDDWRPFLRESLDWFARR